MDKIKAFFRKIAESVLQFFAGPGGRVIRGAVADLIAQLGPAVVSVLLDVAEAKAKELEPLSRIDGDAKFDQVKAAVIQAGLRAGKDVAGRSADTIVQLAAQSVRGS